MKSSFKLIIFVGIIVALIFGFFESASQHSDKLLASQVFAGMRDTTSFYSPTDSATAQELACQRAWNSLRWLVDSATALAIMREREFNWEEVGATPQQAIYDHQLLAGQFYDNMMVVFDAGGPVAPWSEQSGFPRDMEDVMRILKSTSTPVLTPAEVAEKWRDYAYSRQ